MTDVSEVRKLAVNTSSKIIRNHVYDKFPNHFGVKATVARISAILKECEVGIRIRYVDLLREFIEGDPHAYSVLQTRANAVSGRPWTVMPAEVEDERGQEVAIEIASFVERAIKAIPRWRQHVNGLLWSNAFGVSAREIIWKQGPNGEWLIERLDLVHSRRLAYDNEWKVRVINFDTTQTTPTFDYTSIGPSYDNTSFGIRLLDYPGKFVIFEPMLCDEYPTREGLGRELMYWLSFKRFAVRDLISFVERFGKPYPDISWKTGREVADEEDILLAERVAKEYGVGTMAGVAHPDTLTILLEGNGSGKYTSGGSGENTPHKGIITLADEQISRLVLGQSYTTNDHQRGLGQSGDPFENTQQYIFRSDASQAEENINRDIIYWLVYLNFGEEACHKYLPHYLIEVDDPERELDFAKTVDLMVKNGHPVGAQWAAKHLGWDFPKDGELILGAMGNPRAFSADGDMEPLDPAQDAAEDAAEASDDETNESTSKDTE